MAVKRVPISQLGSAPVGFDLDEDKFIASLSQLDALMGEQENQSTATEDYTEDIAKLNTACEELRAEGAFERAERLAYPERFDANGKRLASNADKEPDETGSVLKEEG